MFHHLVLSWMVHTEFQPIRHLATGFWVYSTEGFLEKLSETGGP